jgi:hypothetical protein
METYGKAPPRAMATRDTAIYVLQQEARQLALEKTLLSRDLDVAHSRQRAAEEKANEAVAQAQKTLMTAEEQARRVLFPVYLCGYILKRIFVDSSYPGEGIKTFMPSPNLLLNPSFAFAGKDAATGSNSASKDCI